MSVVALCGKQATVRAQTQHSNVSGGGGMDDVLKRLGAVEISVSELKAQVSSLVATAVHLVTKADLAEAKTELKGDTASLRTEVKEDIANLRTEVKEDIASLRTELKGDTANLRTELKGDIASLRTEVKGDIASLRTEVKGDIAGLRTDLNTDIAALRTDLKGDIAQVKTDVAHMESSLIKWIVATLIAAVSMAFVIARYVAP